MKPLSPNTLIQNRYLVVQLVGKGGMGEVYLAVDQRLGSAVALKRTRFANDEMLGIAFEREAKTLARLRHPVLPKVSDHFLENNEQYLVMEHIAGDDLSKRLEGAQKPFPLSWVLFWADQLLDALSYLHSHEPPIIHRDIKPQNLKLTDENHIVLLDFGLSKNSTGQTLISSTGSSSSSATSGSVVGYTPHYAPMEQIRGTGTSPRSDIYSLSATLYQLMTNTVPADALTRADALLNGSPDPIRPPHEINPEISPVVSDVILKGMEVTQEKRFAKASEMQKALRKAFTKMQEAMTAQTVAFTVEGSGLPEHPPVKQASMRPTEAVNFGPNDNGSEMPTRVSTPGVKADNFANDASGGSGESVRQSDIKTEVFLAGSTPWAETPAETSWPQEVSDRADSGELDSRGSSGELPPVDLDATAFVPDSDRTEQGAAVPEFFTTPNVGQSADAFMTFTPARDERDEVEAEAEAEPAVRQDPVTPPPAVKRSSSRIGLVIGGLMAAVVLLAITVGAGWFVYSNYYAGTSAEADPTPEATPVFTPTPAPTADMADLPANTETDPGITVEPTPVPTVRDLTADAPEDTKTVPQTTPRRTPTRQTTTSGRKPTPKPKTSSDRTVILQ